MNQNIIDLKLFKDKVFNTDSKISSVPEEIGISLPVPSLNSSIDNMVFDFFYFYMRPVESGKYNISTPKFMSFVKYVDIEFLETVKIEGEFNNVKVDPGSIAGIYESDPSISYDQKIKAIDEFYLNYSVVVMAYLSGALNEADRQSIKYVKNNFNKIAFKPLYKYYYSMNPDFFDWIFSIEE